MSVSPRLSIPLRVERLKREGKQPKILAGSQVKPILGAAETNSPHQQPSAGTCVLSRLPKVRKTTVDPWEFTLTPVGFT